MKYYIVLKKDRKNEYYIQICHKNGRLIVKTGDGYKSKMKCIKAVYNMLNAKPSEMTFLDKSVKTFSKTVK